MVKDSETIIETINKKLTNYLKSFPLIHASAPNVKCLLTQNKKSIYVQINLTINNIEYSSETLIDQRNLDINNFIHDFVEKIPKSLKEIRVINLINFSKPFLKNFKETLEIDTFILNKLPYRQLSIVVKNRCFYLNLSKESYYKVKRALRSLNKTTVDFSVFINNLKRREILTLLLLLSQS